MPAALLHGEALLEEVHAEGGVGSGEGSLLPWFGDCWKGEWSRDVALKGIRGRVVLGR